MSSSSIEVMGGAGEMQMMLMSSDDVGIENIEETHLQTLEAAVPAFAYSNQMEEEEHEIAMEEEEEFTSMGLPPGSILFSPQDVVGPPVSKRGRGRGRGRGKGPSLKRGSALTIKLEDGVDYSKINLPVACEICGRIMANGKILVQHMTTHLHNKEFQCPHCPKSFTRMVQLQGHLVYHGIQKQFECPICHQRFSRQDCVRVHMRLHDKSKCVFCVVCHKAFLTLGALNIHMRIHRGEKPFKCHLCGKCFTQKNHVITHIKRHTKIAASAFSKKLGPRMFQCEHCPRSFIRLSDYERHVQWNHGAVADTSIIDKHVNESSIEKQSGDSYTSMDDFMSPIETLNHKVKKKGSIRRVMCTIGTQTDMEGGHVIIPRQFQNASSMTSSSTQVSAPPTPRATEEELYENDIFDEGMDRNYSSDEDDETEVDNKDGIRLAKECEVSTMEYPQQISVHSSMQNDAFDAVLRKSKPLCELKKNEYTNCQDNKEDSTSMDNEDTSNSEVVINIENDEASIEEPEKSKSNSTFQVGENKLLKEDKKITNSQSTTLTDSEMISQIHETKNRPIAKLNEAQDAESQNLQASVLSQEPQESVQSQKLQVSVSSEESQASVPQQVSQVTAAPQIHDSTHLQVPDVSIPKTAQKKIIPKVFQKPITPSHMTRKTIQKPIKPILTQSIKNTFAIPKEPIVEKGEAEPMIRVPVQDRSILPTGHNNVQQHHTKILDTFNTKNWKGRGLGRVRGRGRVKGVIGLTGATHLRLIRKSMMNFISEKAEQLNDKEKESIVCQEAELAEKRKAKRQNKSKQHGKDFVCHVRACETCRPSPVPLKDKEPPNEKESSAIEVIPSKTNAYDAPKDQSQKLLQFLVSGDASNLQGTDFRILSEVGGFRDGSSNDAGIFLPSSSNVENLTSSITGTVNNNFTIGDTKLNYSNLQEKNEYYTALSSQGDDIISPPVELQSFCIPTYSCKLCGREFRFEGKLHRHIEAVHQKKSIFSPDVKPGRTGREQSSTYMEWVTSEEAEEENEAEEEASSIIAQNPEIEALRSEWDDDEADDMDEPMSEPQPKVSVPTSSLPSHMVINTPASFQRRQIRPMIKPIVTKDIVATTNTVTDVYIRGVRMNINKLAGLAGAVEIVDYTPYAKKNELENETILESNIKAAPEDCLDTKCRKLLEKLFDHSLLIQCGLYNEHVSVVLGRINKNYGVKMIEDYGQGQYEVLKYNLWRLIEWKVTMEQMEEFYTEGKSVEEMMDDIMNGRVPIIAHHEMLEEETHDLDNSESQENQIATTSVETVQLPDGQLVISQVANVLGGQINLPAGVTQVVLAQDVSPELLQGAHIVTIDPATGQVLSQVTADQVILSNSHDLGHQIQTMTGQTITVTSLPPGSIVSNTMPVSRNADSSHINSSMSQGRIEKLHNS